MITITKATLPPCPTMGICHTRISGQRKSKTPKMINGVPYMFKGGNVMKIPQIQVGTTVNCPGQVTIFRWVF